VSCSPCATKIVETAPDSTGPSCRGHPAEPDPATLALTVIHPPGRPEVDPGDGRLGTDVGIGRELGLGNEGAEGRLGNPDGPVTQAVTPLLEAWTAPPLAGVSDCHPRRPKPDTAQKVQSAC
jgi:hypothetical protein